MSRPLLREALNGEGAEPRVLIANLSRFFEPTQRHSIHQDPLPDMLKPKRQCHRSRQALVHKRNLSA